MIWYLTLRDSRVLFPRSGSTVACRGCLFYGVCLGIASFILRPREASASTIQRIAGHTLSREIALPEVKRRTGQHNSANTNWRPSSVRYARLQFCLGRRSENLWRSLLHVRCTEVPVYCRGAIVTVNGRCSMSSAPSHLSWIPAQQRAHVEQ